MFFCYFRLVYHSMYILIYIPLTHYMFPQFSGPAIRHITVCNTIYGGGGGRRGFGRDVIRSIKYTWIAEMWLSKQSVFVF